MSEKIVHTIKPVFDHNSKILILGTMPSPKSREQGFFYMHPQNRFWKVLPALFDESIPKSIDDKKTFLLKHKIALWDVLKECSIIGADDSSISNTIPNDFSEIFSSAKINMVFTTGAKATALYKKYYTQKYDIPYQGLPSTSPANCRYYNLEKLIKEYSIILQYL